jgi:hypothetical protein
MTFNQPFHKIYTIVIKMFFRIITIIITITITITITIRIRISGTTIRISGITRIRTTKE